MIKCTECGYENMDGLDYCDSCGAKLNQAAAPSEAPAPAAVAPDAPTGVIAAAHNAEHAAGAEHGASAEHAGGAEHAGSAEHAASAESHEASSAAPEPVPLHPATAAEPVATEQPTPAAPEPAAAGVPPEFKAKLKIVRGGRQGHEFPLEVGNNLVGRWDPETGAFPEVDLEADDPEAKISRKHALIRIEGVKITVEDIGSLNGTYVNRQPRLAPGAPHDLKDGDEIIVGKTFFKVVVEPVS